MAQNHLCNSGREHYGEYSCEIIFKLGPVVQEMLFKDKFYGQQTVKNSHRRQPQITIAHIEPLAQAS